MKLNLDYYNKDLDLKTISEEYDEVLEKVNTNKEYVSETLDEKSKIKNILALSEIRENILNWYDFKNGCSILELNANYGEITGLLCDRAKDVVSIEKSLKYSEVIQKRHKNRENLEVIVGNLDNIKIKKKFDYVVIIGIANEIKNYFDFAKKYLKNDGVVLIAVNNKYGIKSWISLKEENKVVSNMMTAVSKKDLDIILKDYNYKYYYPLPDYKLPNIIYTDNHRPSLSNINRDLTYKDEDVNFKEVDAYREILKDEPEKVLDFANSFLIEASKKDLIDNEIKFITFSNIRKDKYRIKTIIKNKKVYKTCINDKSKEHIETIKRNIDMLNNLGIKTLDSYDDNYIISNYCDGLTLNKQLLKIIEEEGIESFIKKVEQYKEFLKDKLQKIDFSENNIFKKYGISSDIDLTKICFVKYGLWDLIFQNCFIIDGEYYFYDQEWFDDNTPVEYIIYRALKYFGEVRRYISLEEMYRKLDLTDYIDLFEKLDDKIQDRIRKSLLWRIHTKDELVKNKIEKMNDLQLELKEQEKKYEDLKNEYEVLKNEYIEKNNEISILKDSLSWKITKPLRKIRSVGKNKKSKKIY